MLDSLPAIHEDAIFIADAHFHPHDPRAFALLEKWIENPPPQVFLMGDIFHLLIGHIPTSLKAHRDLLELLHTLSLKTEVFYFEGNHDFALPQSLLPRIKLYPRILQPAPFRFQDKHIFLAHGDIFISKAYSLYIRTLNHPFTLTLLRLLDYLTLGILYKSIAKKILKKPIKTLHNTHNFAQNRLALYRHYARHLYPAPLEFDCVIEGHFHTTIHTSSYLAIPSYHCHQKSLSNLGQKLAHFRD